MNSKEMKERGEHQAEGIIMGSKRDEEQAAMGKGHVDYVSGNGRDGVRSK